MSIVPKSCPPEFASGKPEMSMPELAFSVVSGSNSPESSAAAAVTTFIVEPGVNGSCVARLRRGPSFAVGKLRVRLRILERVGLVAGDRAMTRTAPVSGSIADRPSRRLLLGSQSIALWRASVATRCASASSVSVMSAPSATGAGQLVDQRRELVLVAGEEVVLRQLDAAASELDEREADRVAEERALSDNCA